MSRRTRRPDFREDLTPEEIETLLEQLCATRRAVCDIQRQLRPLCPTSLHLDSFKRSIDQCQVRWTGNLTHFYAGHTVISVEPAND